MRDIHIILNNQPYALRPAFDALCSIEQELGIGIAMLAGKVADGEITLQELVSVITACIETSPDFPIGDAVVRGGIIPATQTIAALLSLALEGCEKPRPMRKDLNALKEQFSF